jgi:hypothetical protein
MAVFKLVITVSTVTTCNKSLLPDYSKSNITRQFILVKYLKELFEG